MSLFITHISSLQKRHSISICATTSRSALSCQVTRHDLLLVTGPQRKLAVLHLHNPASSSELHCTQHTVTRQLWSRKTVSAMPPADAFCAVPTKSTTSTDVRGCAPLGSLCRLFRRRCRVDTVASRRTYFHSSSRESPSYCMSDGCGEARDAAVNQ